jgi:hypothetical protein
MKRVFINSFIYFAIVFLVGFILGTLRVLFLVPAMGERYAELIEIPFMLTAIYYSARYIVNRYSAIKTLTEYIYIGALALLMLLLFEFTFVLGIRGIAIDQYFSTRDPISGTAYALSLFIFMMMPLIIAKTRSKPTGV